MRKILSLMMLVSLVLAAGSFGATIKSTDSGSWTNTAIWDLAQVPTAADRVEIKFEDSVTVDNAGNEVGSLRFESGKGYLTLSAGSSLTIVNGGAFPTNGSVSFNKTKTADAGLTVDGGSLTVQGSYDFFASAAGTTNILYVNSGSVDLNFLGIATDGAGVSELYLDSAVTSFRVGGNLTLGAGARIIWDADAAGNVTKINSDNFKNINLNGNGELVVDLSALAVEPEEIILIDNNGSDAINGTFASTNLIGSSNYELVYNGGDGNDVALQYKVSAPADSGLIVGWTKAVHPGVLPISEKDPDEAGLVVSLQKVDVNFKGIKDGWGSSDNTYGSGLYANIADEAAIHSSTSCVALGVDDTMEIVVSNAYADSSIRLDMVLTDWAAPFNDSPKTINVKYLHGDLDLADGTLLATQDGTTSGTGFYDFNDVDALLTGHSVSERTLSSGEYAVFEISFSTNLFGSTGICLVDNVGVGAVVSSGGGLSGYDEWAQGYPTLIGGQQDDDDNDGLTNLEEFGLGGNPTNSADIGYEPVLTTGTDYIDYTHVRRTTANNGLTYWLEQDDDLVAAPGWTNSGDYVIIATNAIVDEDEFEEIVNRISTAGKMNEFIRLVIE